jgi:hypothetical protein
MMTFQELQELITATDVYVFYDNDFWELRRYPLKMELTPEQDRNCIGLGIAVSGSVLNLPIIGEM